MSDHPQYLSNEATVNSVYDKLVAGDVDGAVASVKAAGDDKAVINAWIALQCDINNVKRDPRLSEALARPGVEFALDKGFTKGAAILLHNIFAFHAPNWDEKVDPAVVPGMVEASRRQVELRKELDDAESLGWAWWDLGMSELIAGGLEPALAAFEEAENVHAARNDRDGAAWAALFKGKALVRLAPDRAAEGKAIMEGAVKTIMEIGADWEKEEMPGIMATVS